METGPNTTSPGAFASQNPHNFDGGVSNSPSSPWDTLLQSRLALFQPVSVSTDMKQAGWARQQLGEDLKEILKAARAVASRCNELNSISRLPPEILASIFALLPQAELLPVAPRQALGFQTLISVTHVCRQWRHIALDHPSFWGHDVCAMSKWVPEQLSRSKQTPISISSHLKFDQDLTTLNSALQEAHRVRRVGLHVGSSSPFPSLHRTLARTLPVLECLSIEIDKWVNTLPQNLILGDAPRLAYLELKHCTPFQTPGPYHNLTELSLDGVGKRWQSEAHFSSVIASMPKLQLLNLTRAIPQTVHPDAGHAPPLALPCLHTITIVDDAPKIQWLWNRIVIPPSTRTFIHRSFSSLENPTSTSLHDYLPAAATDPQNSLPLRTISINCFLSGEWCVKGWTSTIIHRPQAWTGRSAVHFDDHFEGEDNLFHLRTSTIGTGPSTVVTAVEAVIHALHAESVTAVHLEDSLPPHDVRVAWDTSFVHFRSVRHLSCQGRNARPAILALQMETGVTETESSAANSESNAPVRWKTFPSLQHLSLSDANLSQEIPRPGQYAFATLVDVVKRRANGGHGDDRLRTVEIKNCRIASARIAEIEACGVVVDWDGEEEITWPATPESGQFAHAHHFNFSFPQPGNAAAFNPIPVAPIFNANFQNIAVNMLHNIQILAADFPGPQPMDLPALDDMPALDDNADEAGATDDVNMDDPDILDNADFDEDAFSGVVW